MSPPPSLDYSFSTHPSFLSFSFSSIPLVILLHIHRSVVSSLSLLNPFVSLCHRRCFGFEVRRGEFPAGRNYILQWEKILFLSSNRQCHVALGYSGLPLTREVCRSVAETELCYQEGKCHQCLFWHPIALLVFYRKCIFVRLPNSHFKFVDNIFYTVIVLFSKGYCILQLTMK